MASADQLDSPAPAIAGRGLALRLTLASGAFAVPLDRLHHLAGYATLTGDPDEYFLGWLMLRGDWVPVFDLNRVVCDQPTPEHFGSRILVVKAASASRTPYIGLLAAHVTDTIPAQSEDVETLDLNAYLPLLYTMIPLGPADA